MRIAGVDEVGRGPLAGPVVAAAVVLAPGCEIRGLRDSKRLSTGRRESLAQEIRTRALCWALGRAEPDEIDAVNVGQASLRAMARAVARLQPVADRVLVDGNRCPLMALPVTAIVGGDDKVAAIAAASIIAKVARDAEMVALAARYPGYGFESHKGYGSRAHLAALAALGASPIHRRSFSPVRAVTIGRLG